MAILLLFLYHDKAGGSNGDAHIASSVERLRLGIGKKISKLFFCIALGLHYLSIRQAAPRHWQKISKLFFCIALGLHYLSIRQAAPRHWQKISKLFFCQCARLALSLHH